MTRKALIVPAIVATLSAGWWFAIGHAQERATQWQILASDGFGWVTPTRLAAMQRESGGPGRNARRFSFDVAPDGSPALLHTIRKGEVIGPFRYDSPVFFPQPGSCAAALTYKMWQEKERWQGRAGKFMALMGGRGMAGGSYLRSPGGQLGDEGWSHVSMHAVIGGPGGKNHIRGYIYSVNRTALGGGCNDEECFGKTYGNSDRPTPTGRWVVISLVSIYNDIDKSNGIARLYLDGKKEAEMSNVMWMRNPSNARGVWMRLRRMYGGNPERLPSLADMKEWYKDFEIHISHDCENIDHPSSVNISDEPFLSTSPAESFISTDAVE